MSLYALYVPTGSTGAFHDVLSPAFTSFLPQIPLYLSFDYAATRSTGTATATLHVELRWYDSTGAALASWTNDTVINATIADTLMKFTVIPPAGATSGKCYIKVTPAASPMQHDVWIKKLRLGKTELSATNGAAWGGNISGTPANLTALTGAEQINNALVPLGTNVVCNSDFSHSGNFTYGWTSGWSGNSGLIPIWGVNTTGYFGTLNVAYATIGTTPAAGTVWDSHSHYPSTEPNSQLNLQRWGMPVAPGDTVFAGALCAIHRATGAYVEIQWWDANGATTTEVGGAVGGRQLGAGNGDPANMDRLGVIAVAPATARFATMRLRIVASGETNPWLFYTQMMLCKLPAGQTAWPPYSPGPPDRSATLGADWLSTVTTRPANLAALAGSEGVNNSLVSLGANGALSGGGGGQVTYDGIGGGAYGDSNRVRYSMFEAGTTGWVYYNPNGFGSPNFFVVHDATSDRVAIMGNWTAANQAVALLNDAALSGNIKFRIPVTPGERIFVGAYLEAGGTLSRWQLTANFKDNNNVALTAPNVNGTGTVTFNTRKGFFTTVPAGAAYVSLEYYAFSDGNTSGAFTLSMARPMVCSAGANQTAFPTFSPGPSNEYGATAGATWGSNIGSVPAPLSAVTNGTSIDNTLVPLGKNFLINSDFSHNAATGINLNYGWTGAWAGNTGFATDWGVNLSTDWSGQTNVAFTHNGYNGGSSGAGAAFDSYYHLPNTNATQLVSDLKRWAMPVYDGDRVFAACLLAHHRCDAFLYIQFFDGNGVGNSFPGCLITGPDIQGPFQGREGGGAQGNPGNFDRAFVFGAVPPGARYAVLRIRGVTRLGQADPYLFYTQMMLTKVAAAQTALPPYDVGRSDLSDLGIAGSGARLGDSRNMPPVQAAGGRYYFSSSPTYTATAGSPASATISMPAGSLTVGSQSISYNAMSVTVTGTGGAAPVYQLYIDDPYFAGGTQTLQATTSTTIPYQNDGRIFLGQIQVTFPTTGSGTGTGTGGGGGGYGCVWEDSWVMTLRGYVRAKDVRIGDWLVVLDYSTMNGLRFEQVTQNRIMPKDGWEIVTEDREARLYLSSETPLTLKDGSAVYPCQLMGQELPTVINGEFAWKPCYAQPLGQKINVCLISCNSQTYAAGLMQDRMILTHNVLQTYAKP